MALAATTPVSEFMPSQTLDHSSISHSEMTRRVPAAFCSGVGRSVALIL